MDRLTAAFHGRPILMHERDIGRDMVGCFERQGSCFRLLLENVGILDRVIRFYRPVGISGGQGEKGDEGDGEIPGFEALVERAGAFGVETRLLGEFGLHPAPKSLLIQRHS